MLKLCICNTNLYPQIVCVIVKHNKVNGICVFRLTYYTMLPIVQYISLCFEVLCILYRSRVQYLHQVDNYFLYLLLHNFQKGIDKVLAHFNHITLPSHILHVLCRAVKSLALVLGFLIGAVYVLCSDAVSDICSSVMCFFFY